MDPKPSNSASQSESDSGRSQRVRKRTTRFDIDDTIKIPIRKPKTSGRDTSARKNVSDNGSFWQNNQ